MSRGSVPRAIASAFVGLALALAFLAPAHVLAWYMTARRGTFVLAVAIALAGVLAAVLVARALYRVRSACPAAIPAALLAVALLAAGGSLRWGGPTWARFGLTVWGVLPIPVADLRVGPDGHLWFRDKTHRITREEIESLASEGAEFVVVGIGWDEVARVDDEARTIPGITIVVRPTPAAFAEYRRLRAQGARVALLAHTTC